MIEMTIDSIRVSLMNYQRVVILKEKLAERYLPIWIGPAEADAIAVKLQGVTVPRPLTHDLLRSIIDTLGATINSIIVSDLKNDTFYAKIILDVDVYRTVQSMLKGMPMDDERLAYEAVKRAGPGGNYLMDEHTLAWMRSGEYYDSPIVNHNGEHGMSMVDRAHAQVEEITTHFRSQVPVQIQEDLDKLLRDYSRISNDL